MLYLEDSQRFSCNGTILACGQDAHGYYIITNQTIFYPQGGGQPYDLGVIEAGSKRFEISAVRWVENEIRHYTATAPEQILGLEATLTIDLERRVLNTRLHTGGHLLSCVVEALHPDWKAQKGHHYPEGSYVEFSCQQITTNEVTLTEINRALAEAIKQDSPIITVNNNPTRLVRIGDYPSLPCGGTHAQGLKELLGLSAVKIKTKGNTMKISYIMPWKRES